MENNAIPTTIRRLLIVTVALLVITLLASGANVYFTMAAPKRDVTVPTTVGFEGRLADTNGVPLEGSPTVTFSLYSQAEGGTTVWSEIKTVPLHNGLYTVQLGETHAFDLSDFDGPRWLAVTVDGNEMAPRIPISSVPFALNAQQAGHADEADLAGEASHAAAADQADEAGHANEADQALGLQGRSVSANAPVDGQALLWSASASQWQPDTIVHAIDSSGARYSMQKLETNSLAYWITNPPLATPSAIVVATPVNKVRFYAVRIESPLHITRFTVWVTTTSNGKHVGVGLYDTGGNLLTSGVATLTAATGAYAATLASPYDLDPGVYYLAWTSDLTTIAAEQFAGSAIFGQSINYSIARLGTASNVSAAGVLPATLGTLTKVNAQPVLYVVIE